MKHLHFVGICGTFMGSLALLARELGYKVTGCDANVYPPMSTQLVVEGVEIVEGYGVEQLAVQPDCFVIGNAVGRGNPLVEGILNSMVPYTSGPQWLSEQVLSKRWVIAVAGTHGKTTTTSMVMHILRSAGFDPGYLVGGIPFSAAGSGGSEIGLLRSASLGSSDFFVIEADEYDTAFFDKRSKFVHYHARTLVINNLEFDHADIFDDLKAIQRQFHHLLRTVPSEGVVIHPRQASSIDEVIEQGCWAPVQRFGFEEEGGGSEFYVRSVDQGACFECYEQSTLLGTVKWSQLGVHNMMNAQAAILATRHVGVSISQAIESLANFKGVKRRLECIGDYKGIRLYDDFAHHPTAIETTAVGLVASLKAAVQAGEERRIILVIEPRSNTMRQGVHQTTLAQSVLAADIAYWFEPAGLSFDLSDALNVETVGSESALNGYHLSRVYDDTQALIEHLKQEVRSGDHVVIMSNGGFEGIHLRLLEILGFPSGVSE